MRKFFLLLIISLSVSFSSGCASTQTKHPEQISYNAILQNREQLTNFEYNINTILNFINAGDLASAQLHYAAIEKSSTSSDEIALLAYAHARLLIASNNPDDAYERLNNAGTTQHIAKSNTQTKLNIDLLNSEMQDTKKLYVEAFKTRVQISHEIRDNSLYLKNHLAIWDTLNKISLPDLKTSSNELQDSELINWLELNTIYRNTEIPLDRKIEALDAWAKKNTDHPASIHPPGDINNLKTQTTKDQQRIALILPFKGKYSALAEAIRDGVIHSYFKTKSQADIRLYNAGVNEPFINIYNQAVADGATLIIGPLLKNQLEELHSQNTLPVKTIALNRLPSAKITENLFQFSLAPEDEIFSIIGNSTESKLRNAFILSQKDEFSQKNMTTFAQAWEQQNNHIIANYSFSESTELAADLEKPLNLIKSKNRSENLQSLLGITLESNPKSRTDIDMVMLFTRPDNAADINLLLNSYLPNDTTKYSNSAIYRGFPDQEEDQALNGIIFTEMPLIIQSTENPSKKYNGSALIRMYAFGMDVYELSGSLSFMSANPSARFEGATGSITLKNNELTRRPSFAIFSNGLLMPLAQVKKE